MSMKNLFLAGAATTMLATSAMAAEPVTLTNSQMDDVTAGINLDVDLALALTGPMTARNLTTATAIQDASMLTTNQVVIGTSVTSLRQTSATGTNQIQATSAGNNGRVRLGGSLAVGGSLSFAN